jgi:RHS repeat-associated protein
VGALKLHKEKKFTSAKGVQGLYVSWRKSCTGGYRYGFNGQEKDNEIKGGGNSLDFGARVYDSRLGRWLSLDPFQANYPDLSPFNFVGNSPLMFIDPDGEKIINAEGLRKLKAEAQIKKLTQSIVQLEISKKNYKDPSDIKAINNSIANSQERLNELNAMLPELAQREQKAQEIIDATKNSPVFKEADKLRNECDTHDVDVYIQVDPNLFFLDDPNIDGVICDNTVGAYTKMPEFKMIDNCLTPSTEEFGNNTILVTFHADPHQNDLFQQCIGGGNVFQHEMGHTIYFANNSTKANDYYKGLKKDGRSLNGGHNYDDKSGQKADEYEKK